MSNAVYIRTSSSKVAHIATSKSGSHSICGSIKHTSTFRVYPHVAEGLSLCKRCAAKQERLRIEAEHTAKVVEDFNAYPLKNYSFQPCAVGQIVSRDGNTYGTVTDDGRALDTEGNEIDVMGWVGEDSTTGGVYRLVCALENKHDGDRANAKDLVQKYRSAVKGFATMGELVAASDAQGIARDLLGKALSAADEPKEAAPGTQVGDFFNSSDNCITRQGQEPGKGAGLGSIQVWYHYQHGMDRPACSCCGADESKGREGRKLTEAGWVCWLMGEQTCKPSEPAPCGQEMTCEVCCPYCEEDGKVHHATFRCGSTGMECTRCGASASVTCLACEFPTPAIAMNDGVWFWRQVQHPLTRTAVQHRREVAAEVAEERPSLVEPLEQTTTKLHLYSAPSGSHNVPTGRMVRCVTCARQHALNKVRLSRVAAAEGPGARCGKCGKANGDALKRPSRNLIAAAAQSKRNKRQHAAVELVEGNPVEEVRQASAGDAARALLACDPQIVQVLARYRVYKGAADGARIADRIVELLEEG